MGTKNNTAAATASTVVVNGLAELMAKQAELKAAKRAVNEAAELEAREAKTVARNPAYVLGSVRSPTDLDRKALGHCHGKVCEIKCQECGEIRVINVQDAFQAKFCVGCRKEANKRAGKDKRAAAKLVGVTPEAIQAQIDALNKLLAAKVDITIDVVEKAA